MQLIACDKRDSHRLTFTDGAHVGRTGFQQSVDDICMCKNHQTSYCYAYLSVQ